MHSFKNKKLRMMLVAGCGAIALSAGVFAMPASAASAETTVSTFEMTYGASIRTDDKRALRFSSNIKVAELDALIAAGKDVKVVTMIAPTDYLDEGETFDANTVWEEGEKAETITFNKAMAVKASWDEAKGKWIESETGSDYVFHACLWDIEDRNLTREFSARSYITVNNEIVTYTDYDKTENSRDIWTIASQAVNDYAKDSDEYKNIAALCGEYSVSVTNEFTGETETITVKRGVKIADDDEYAKIAAITEDVEYQAYFEGLVTAEGAYADSGVTSDLTLTAKYGALAFELNEDGETYSVAKGTLSAGHTDTVVIPDTYKGKNVTALAAEHKFNGSQFKTIKISNNITTLPGNAFFSCSNLETVIMPSVTKTEATNVFYLCSSLTTVVVNADATFSRKTFHSDCATKGVEVQVDLYIAGTENNITYWNWANNTKDATNDMLTGIVYYYSESNLCGTWNYGEDGLTIEKRAAQHSYINGDCEYCDSFDAEGVVYAYDAEKDCYYVANNGKIEKETVKILAQYNDGVNGTKDVTYVVDSAFHSNTKVKTIILPNSVTTVGGSAFFGCTNLETVIMPSVLETTGINVFCRSPKVTTVVVNPNATFYRKTFMTDTAGYTASINICVDGTENKITMSENNMIAGTYLYSANSDCGTWAWNETKDGVVLTVHSERADGYCANCFAKLDATKAVNYAWDETTTTYYVANGKTVTASTIYVGATFNDGEHGEAKVTYVAGSAFADNTKIVAVVLPDSVTSVGGSAFWGCTKLATVVMAGVTKTENVNVFYKCTSLKTVVVNSEAKFSRKTFTTGTIDGYTPQVDLYIDGTENKITYWRYDDANATEPYQYDSQSDMLSGVEYLTGEWSYDENGLPVINAVQA